MFPHKKVPRQKQELSPPVSHGFWMSDSTAGHTHTRLLPLDLQPTETVAGTCPTPRQGTVMFSPCLALPACPTLLRVKGLHRGCTAGLGEGLHCCRVATGYCQVTGTIPNCSVWSSMLWHSLPPQQDPSTPVARIGSLAAQYRVAANASHPFHILP